MFYDTLYRHNQALNPDPDATVGVALHGLLSGIDDCRRAGKGFLPNSEVTWFRCACGMIAGRPCHGKAALLLEPGRFARRLAALRDARPPLPVAA